MGRSLTPSPPALPHYPLRAHHPCPHRSFWPPPWNQGSRCMDPGCCTHGTRCQRAQHLFVRRFEVSPFRVSIVQRNCAEGVTGAYWPRHPQTRGYPPSKMEDCAEEVPSALWVRPSSHPETAESWSQPAQPAGNQTEPTAAPNGTPGGVLWVQGLARVLDSCQILPRA